MAHQHSVVFIDDIDGSEAAQTVAFSLDGQQYEIDLSAQNIQRLYDALAPYTSKARRIRGEPGPTRLARKPHPVGRAVKPAPVSTRPPAAGAPAGSAGAADTSRDIAAGGDPVGAAPEPGNVAPSRRSVPAAVFSDSGDYVPPRQQKPPKPHTTALFSPAG